MYFTKDELRVRTVKEKNTRMAVRSVTSGDYLKNLLEIKTGRVIKY